ncbi:putative stress response protein NST1 [Colletotrichum karsti]|uniref:Stress response protein NST1 n=1 Tax=Colletotrichum karsti TaxID=1095194 RepID=A0A9P6I9W8_9PEZI|nr:putative stress response protein NST1 [Colletotrichum karsti]KAF9876651.1 putative stress response protein NST1 [Colletotrichum karsti]
MPANHRQPPSPAPPSPNTKATARYTNKDGSKIITVPKGPPSTEPSLPSTPTSSAKAPTLQTLATNGADAPAPVVNRKKQKRREKAAARAAAEQAAVPIKTPNGRPSPAPSAPAPKPQAAQDDADQDFSDDEADDAPSPDHHLFEDHFASSKSKKSKKKKKKNGKNPQLGNSQYDNVPHPHSPSTPRGPGISKDKIWNTSSQEERERIKEFWLGLGEDERKSLVKVEKDAVLKKMKEQQKHTCSCTVCGRKRTAIEEELEGLYDAYYEELENFAHQGEGPPLLGRAGISLPLRPPRTLGKVYVEQQPPSHGRIVEHVGDDEDEDDLGEEEDVYSDQDEDLEDDEYDSEEDPSEDAHDLHPHDHPHDRDMADFLTFGNSLQVKGMKLLDSLLCRYGNMDLGGILTVADDLLKNDGKRFIEMMEQLAERRMAREEDAKEQHFSRYGHPPNGSYSNHGHSPPEDEYDDEDEEEDEDYDDSQDDDYEDEEVSSSQYTYDHKHSSTEHICCHHQDTMTEEQRMEEGRRMFQIFAARMFEQRVLTAYRDMVSRQRQAKLIEELEEENRQDAQRKAKKAKENQKRKDKAALKKKEQAEEKARKEAEKAAEEAARLEEQKRKAEEQRLRTEEKRRKKEEQKRAEEEERLRREAERQRRAQEQEKKRLEQERKARELKEKQKAKEAREKETREQKEREARERKEKQEQAKRDKDAKAKAEREAKADRENKERLKQDEKAQKAAAVAAAAAAPIPIPNPGRRPSQHPAPIPTPHSNPASYASPKISVATPALPKAPTPIRPKNANQPLDASVPGSHASSSTSQNPSPHPATPGHTSPAPFGSRKESVATTASLPHPQSVSPSTIKGPLGSQPSPFGMPMGMPPPGFGGPPPGLGNRMHDQMFGLPGGMPGFRPPPGMMPGPPGLNGPVGRGFMPQPPPGFGQPMVDPLQGMGSGPVSHSRQASGSFDPASSPAPSQPIGRPTPIGRPGSVGHGQLNDQTDEFANQHLGSSALLDDAEDLNPISAAFNAARQRNQPPRPAFPSTPFGMDNGFHNMNNVWGSSPMAFAPVPPPGFANPTWGGPMMPMPSLNQIRSAGNPRSVTVRMRLCRACKELQALNEDPESFIDLSAVKAKVDHLSPSEAIPEDGLMELAETEGNAHNGGGTFEVRRDANGPGRHTVRWVPEPNDMSHLHHRAVGAPGEIGSPIINSGSLAFATSRGH